MRGKVGGIVADGRFRVASMGRRLAPTRALQYPVQSDAVTDSNE